MTEPSLPAWVGDFLNRRTTVEGVLRDVGAGLRPPLSPEESKALAEKLSIPSEHLPAGHLFAGQPARPSVVIGMPGEPVEVSDAPVTAGEALDKVAKAITEAVCAKLREIDLTRHHIDPTGPLAERKALFNVIGPEGGHRGTLLLSDDEAAAIHSALTTSGVGWTSRGVCHDCGGTGASGNVRGQVCQTCDGDGKGGT